jgi:hypothetical protein
MTQLGSFLDSLLKESQTFRSRLESEWAENESAVFVYPTDREDRFRDRVLQAAGARRRLPPVYFNELLRLITHAAAILTDSKPAFDVVITSLKEHNIRWQTTLRKVLDSVWVKNGLAEVLGRTVFDLFLYGSSFWRVEWDPWVDDVSVRRLPPHYVHVDPTASSLEAAQWICYRAPVSLWDLARKYPQDMLKDVVPDASLAAPTATTSIERLTNKVTTSVPRVWFEEWLIKAPDKDEDGNLIYPNGRLVIRAGGVILVDMPCPLWEPWPPLWVSFRAPYGDSIYGYPVVSSARSIQRWINEFGFQLLRSVYEGMRPVWVVDLESLPPSEERKLGAVLRKVPQSEVRRDVGLGLAPGVPETFQLLSQKLSYVIGLSEVIGARPPRSVTAAAALDALTAATQATLRWFARVLEVALGRVAFLILTRVLQQATPDYVVAFVTDYGKTEILKVFEDVTQEERRKIWKLVTAGVRPGSMLGLYKERLENEIMQRYAMGLIDREAALEALDVPDWPKILERAQAQAATGFRETAARIGPSPRGRGASVVRARVGGR